HSGRSRRAHGERRNGCDRTDEQHSCVLRHYPLLRSDDDASFYPTAIQVNTVSYAAAVEPISIDVLRGDVVEARHRVHAVAVSDGDVVASAGNPSLFTLFRSSAKPLQALPIVRARPDLDDA